jgi:hypothetical protein
LTIEFAFMSDPVLPPADSIESLYCPGCGYDLRSISSDRCPECGLSIDPSAVSPIPWCHRHRLGRFRAFFRTVWMATVRPGRIAAAVAGPVDEKGANRFRWCVIPIAAFPLLAITIGGLIYLGHIGTLNVSVLPPSNLYTTLSGSWFDVPVWETALLLFNGITFWPIACIGIVMTLAMCSRAGSFWFAGRTLSPMRRKRAIAISSYAFAPLVMLGIPTAAALLLALQYAPNMALGIVCVLSSFLLLLLCWFNTLRLLRGATHCGAGRIIVAGFSLPILWAIAAIIGLGLFPALVGLLRIMIDSLR